MKRKRKILSYEEQWQKDTAKFQVKLEKLIRSIKARSYKDGWKAGYKVGFKAGELHAKPIVWSKGKRKKVEPLDTAIKKVIREGFDL